MDNPLLARELFCVTLFSDSLDSLEPLQPFELKDEVEGLEYWLGLSQASKVESAVLVEQVVPLASAALLVLEVALAGLVGLEEGSPAYFLTFTFSFLIVVVFLAFDNSGCLYLLSSTLGTWLERNLLTPVQPLAPSAPLNNQIRFL